MGATVKEQGPPARCFWRLQFSHNHTWLLLQCREFFLSTEDGVYSFCFTFRPSVHITASFPHCLALLYQTPCGQTSSSPPGPVCLQPAPRRLWPAWTTPTPLCCLPPFLPSPPLRTRWASLVLSQSQPEKAGMMGLQLAPISWSDGHEACPRHPDPDPLSKASWYELCFPSSLLHALWPLSCLLRSLLNYYLHSKPLSQARLAGTPLLLTLLCT